MDNSKEYIKKCERAKEIQKEWEDISGDFYVSKSDYSISGIRHNIDTTMRPKEDCIWLPYQHQLQKMIDLKYFDWEIRYTDQWEIGSYDDDGYFDIEFQAKTLEQLWLIFVMKEKYNKIWNGKDWIKEK